VEDAIHGEKNRLQPIHMLDDPCPGVARKIRNHAKAHDVLRAPVNGGIALFAVGSRNSCLEQVP
jgi:hypothetical protein